MLRRTWRVFRVEWAKAWRTKLPYLGVAASMLMAVIARQSMEGLETSEGITAPAYFTAAVNMAATLFIPIFATIFAAMLVASETTRGTLRTVLTRPIQRHELLTGKLAAGIAYLFVLFFANVGTVVLLARNYPLKSAFDRSISIPGMGQQIGIFSIALALTLLPLIATVCFGFLVSVLSANVSTAIGVAVGLLLSVMTAKNVRWAGNVEEYIFLSYYDTALGIASSKTSGIYDDWMQSRTYYLVATSVLSAIIFLVISYRRFSRKDLNY